MKWLKIDRALADSGFKIFTDREFRAISGVTATAAKFMLIRYTRRGLLCRLKRGLYAVRGRMPSPWIIANHLYKPSYVSLESALSYHGLIPESVYATVSATTKTTREFEADGKAYLYRTIKKIAFAGYRSVSIDGETVLMAEPEKALADYLYFALRYKGPLNERLTMERVDRDKLLEYVKLFSNPKLLRWVEYDLKIPDRRTTR